MSWLLPVVGAISLALIPFPSANGIDVDDQPHSNHQPPVRFQEQPILGASHPGHKPPQAPHTTRVQGLLGGRPSAPFTDPLGPLSLGPGHMRDEVLSEVVRGTPWQRYGLMGSFSNLPQKLGFQSLPQAMGAGKTPEPLGIASLLIKNNRIQDQGFSAFV